MMFRRFMLDLVQREVFGEDGIAAPKIGAEIGVGCGAMSAGFLGRFPNLTMYMVDAWAPFPENSPYRQSGDKRARLRPEDYETRFQATLDVTAFAATRTHPYRMLSIQAASRIPDSYLDFVFIDASHAYEDVKADLAAWWPKVKPGGLFSGHDYGHHKHAGVKQAVDEFLAPKGVFEVHPTAVWWIKKRWNQ